MNLLKLTKLYQHLTEIAMLTITDKAELEECLKGLSETHHIAVSHNLSDEEFNYLSQRLKESIFNYYL